MQKLTQYELDLILEFCPRPLDLSFFDMSGLDLSGADFTGAKLTDAGFTDAEFTDADFTGADFTGAKLTDATFTNADFTDADCTFTDFTRAKFTRVNFTRAKFTYTNFNRANLTDAKIDYQIEKGLLQRIAQIVVDDPTQLRMSSWHSICETAHCVAGFACELAEKGKELEGKYGTQIAGLLLLGAEAHSHFWDGNKTALSWLKTKL